jgi:hypothetical protein
MFGQQSFRQNLGFGDNGETREDDRIVASIFRRSGTHIMGKRLFEEERHRA